MREGLSTGDGAGWAGNSLSGPVFSGPDDCAELVNCFQGTGIAMFFRGRPEHFDAGGVRRDGTEIELRIGAKEAKVVRQAKQSAQAVTPGVANSGKLCSKWTR